MKRRRKTFVHSLPIDNVCNFFVITIGLSLTITCVLLGYVPLPDKIPAHPVPPDSFTTKMNDLSDFNKEIAEAARFAFESYFYRCSDSDEINAISGKCLNTYGFQSTLLESIETLKMLGLDDLFNKTVRMVKSQFRCRNLGWVNRHELWSRIIGSLIGSYFMTQDYFFLEQAEECASLSLTCEGINKLPSAFVNLRNQTRKPLLWRNGTSLNDVGGGLPELLALYQLTGNKTYHRLYERTIKHVSKMSNMWNFLTNRRGQRSSDIIGLDALTMSFYRNVEFSNKMVSTPYSAKITQKAQHMGYFHGNFSQYFSILDAYNRIPFAGLENLKREAINHYALNGDLFRPGDDFHNGGLRFNGAPLRGLVRIYWETGDSQAKAAVTDAIRSVIELCKMEFGFSGIKHSNANQFKFDGIQHTAFISEWMKAGVLLDPAFEMLAKSAVFNERGHLLHYRELYDISGFI